ncbi:hypothetical protein [Bradyrhizobium sp. SZCCHNRI2010]|nr:hypothetical protein [Bradyrhizobium sp. SZCCHNRI2010]
MELFIVAIAIAGLIFAIMFAIKDPAGFKRWSEEHSEQLRRKRKRG